MDRIKRKIMTAYKKAFEAKIDCFLDVLIESEGDIFGISFGLERIFAKVYFDDLLLTLKEKYNENISPNEIAEIGNLVLVSGDFEKLIPIGEEIIKEKGIKYILFTTIPVVFDFFKNFGYYPEYLCDAKIERLPEEEREKWGYYYNKNPKVYVIKITSI